MKTILFLKPCGMPDKSFSKKLSVLLSLQPVFYILSMNAQNSLHPLINHMHEVLQQLNHEEYSQKPWRDP